MQERPLNAYVAQALRESERMRAGAAGQAVAPAREAIRRRDLAIDDLAVAAAAGDVEAVGRLYDRLVAPIYRYVAVRVHRREDAEDLTQLVFERIVTSLPRYRSRGRPFEAWAFRIARNAVIDHVRRDRAHEPLSDGHEAGHDESPDRLTVRGEEIRELRRAIATLTVDQQEALALRFAAGLSAEEAAVVMGRRAGTVRGLTFRAIASLRRRLLTDEAKGR
jgi:RNA polymerase sigma-70 factor (ECF subfamily)